MIKYIFFIILFFYTHLNAEIVNKIIIDGNSRISDETIKVYGEISLSENYNDQSINKILKNLFSTNFFEDVKVDFSGGVLKIFVEEYPIINSIQIMGEETKRVKEAIFKKLNLQENNSFVKESLNQDMQIIKKMYSSIGFNFTEVNAKIEDVGSKRVNLYFFVKKGEKTKISKIQFIGDKKVKDRRLRDIIVSEEDNFWKFITKNTNLNDSNIELDKRLLTNYYKSIGYYDVQILSSFAEINKNRSTTLTYNINAGTRYRIAKISTDINPIFDKKIFSVLEKDFSRTIGKYYSPLIVKKLLDRLDIVINNNDLQFVKHSVNEVIEGNTIEIQINIDESEKILVERIDITGNIITDEGVIRGELLLDEGDPFNSLKLEQSLANLKSRNMFGAVKKTVSDGSSSDLKQIEINVEEKPTGEISAGAGVGTNGGSLSFQVSENNWLGKGIRLSSFLDASQNSLKGQISVVQPNYNFTGNSLSYNLSSTTTDAKDTSGYKNNLINVGVGTSFEQYRNIYLSPSLNLTYDDLAVQKTASRNMKKQAGAFTDLAFSYGITTDLRDRSFMPTDGYRTNFTQTLPVYADTPYIKNSISHSTYQSFGKDIIGAFKIYGAAITGLDDKDVRLSKRIRLPGNRLRGFKNGKVGPKDGGDYIGGNYAAAINFEAALPNFLPEATRTEVSLFLDVGNIWGVDYSEQDGKALRSSTGANISWSSPIGPMSFIFATNLRKAETDVTEGFNFRLGTTF